MKNIKVFEYSGPALVSVETSERISADICALLPEAEVLIDFEGVIMLTTQCANAILSKPFSMLGVESFKKKISFKNENTGIAFILSTVITDIATR